MNEVSLDSERRCRGDTIPNSGRRARAGLGGKDTSTESYRLGENVKKEAMASIKDGCPFLAWGTKETTRTSVSVIGAYYACA